ncbi:hypothetical protein GCM10010350_44130 [Streptomyces galilaeus]|nr:hypothetical protein GCM10010350_44130 [Streptomyces galilaeus]
MQHEPWDVESFAQTLWVQWGRLFTTPPGDELERIATSMAADMADLEASQVRDITRFLINDPSTPSGLAQFAQAIEVEQIAWKMQGFDRATRRRRSRELLSPPSTSPTLSQRLSSASWVVESSAVPLTFGKSEAQAALNRGTCLQESVEDAIAAHANLVEQLLAEDDDTGSEASTSVDFRELDPATAQAIAQAGEMVDHDLVMFFLRLGPPPSPHGYVTLEPSNSGGGAHK